MSEMRWHRRDANGGKRAKDHVPDNGAKRKIHNAMVL